jgi:hypothetical protein
MSTGQYMNVLFGGWEAATAVNAAADTLMGPSTGPMDQMRRQQAAIQQASGGIMGSMAMAGFNLADMTAVGMGFSNGTGIGPLAMRNAIFGAEKGVASAQAGSGRALTGRQMDRQAQALDRDAARFDRGRQSAFNTDSRAAADEVAELGRDFQDKVGELQDRRATEALTDSAKAGETTKELNQYVKKQTKVIEAARKKFHAALKKDGKELDLAMATLEAANFEDVLIAGGATFGQAVEGAFEAGLAADQANADSNPIAQGKQRQINDAKRKARHRRIDERITGRFRSASAASFRNNFEFEQADYDDINEWERQETLNASSPTEITAIQTQARQMRDATGRGAVMQKQGIDANNDVLRLQLQRKPLEAQAEMIVQGTLEAQRNAANDEARTAIGEGGKLQLKLLQQSMLDGGHAESVNPLTGDFSGIGNTNDRLQERMVELLANIESNTKAANAGNLTATN